MARKGKKGNGTNDLLSQNAALTRQIEALTALVTELQAELKKLRGGMAVTSTDASPAEVAATSGPAGGATATTKVEHQAAVTASEQTGWTPLKPRKRRAVQAVASSSVAEPQASPTDHGLQLRADDWPVPILPPEGFKNQAIGIASLPLQEARRVYCDLRNASGQMAVVTRQAIPEAKESCRKFHCKFLNKDKRLIIVDRFLTTFGDGRRIKPLYERTAEVNKVTLDMTDDAKRVVVQVSERHAPEKLYKEVKQAPQLALQALFKDDGLQDSVLYYTRPITKVRQDEEWVESVVTLRADGYERFLQASGVNGMFRRPFVTDPSSSDTDFKVAFFPEGTSLADALATVSRHPAVCFGLVHNRRGFGVRVRSANFKDSVTQLFGAEAAERETAKEGTRVYEIGKVPPWVRFDELALQLGEKLGWRVAKIREIRGWNTKTFLVRSDQPPSDDAVVVDSHWLPIQAARARKPLATSRFQLKDQPAQAGVQPSAKGKAPVTSAAHQPRPPPAARSEASSNRDQPLTLDALNRALGTFWETIEGRFRDLETKLDADFSDCEGSEDPASDVESLADDPKVDAERPDEDMATAPEKRLPDPRSKSDKATKKLRQK